MCVCVCVFDLATVILLLGIAVFFLGFDEFSEQRGEVFFPLPARVAHAEKMRGCTSTGTPEECLAKGPLLPSDLSQALTHVLPAFQIARATPLVQSKEELQKILMQ